MPGAVAHLTACQALPAWLQALMQWALHLAPARQPATVPMAAEHLTSAMPVSSMMSFSVWKSPDDMTTCTSGTNRRVWSAGPELRLTRLLWRRLTPKGASTILQAGMAQTTVTHWPGLQCGALKLTLLTKQ